MQRYDVIVVGSGIGGLAVALAAAERGMSIALLEKDSLLGGGTALSHGILWAGSNHLAKAAGVTESRDAVLQYMHYVAGGSEDRELLETFVDHAPEALEFFSRCGVRMTLMDNFPDHYYPVAPGSAANCRCIEVLPISMKEVGEWKSKIRDSFVSPRRLTLQECIGWGGLANMNGWDREVLSARTDNDIKTGGPALIAYFMKAVLARGVCVLLESPVDEILHDAEGVIGVRTSQGLCIEAARAVVLATGGWEGDPELLHRFEGFPDGRSTFPRAVSGDGFRLGTQLGAATALIRNNLAIMLGFHVPASGDASEAEFHLAQIIECQCPHNIIVNAAGNRFSDESYFQDTAEALRQYDVWGRRFPNSPSFLIFDQQYVDAFSFAGAKPGCPPPHWVVHRQSLEQLAEALGIYPSGLQRTVQQFNDFAREGVDLDFHRGERKWSLANEKAFADGNQRNCRLGTLEKPPFYGVRLFPGIFSSSGGLRCDSQARVLDVRGKPITRLYATGNVAAHLEYGIGYQAGYSLTSAMTFAYLAARHIAGAEATVRV